MQQGLKLGGELEWVLIVNNLNAVLAILQALGH